MLAPLASVFVCDRFLGSFFCIANSISNWVATFLWHFLRAKGFVRSFRMDYVERLCRWQHRVEHPPAAITMSYYNSLLEDSWALWSEAQTQGLDDDCRSIQAEQKRILNAMRNLKPPHEWMNNSVFSFALQTLCGAKVHGTYQHFIGVLVAFCPVQRLCLVREALSHSHLGSAIPLHRIYFLPFPKQEIRLR